MFGNRSWQLQKKYYLSDLSMKVEFIAGGQHGIYRFITPVLPNCELGCAIAYVTD